MNLKTRPLVIAHRGDSFNALENSIEAIHRALSYPADMIELDVRKSRDNVLYVMHDRSTGRTADRDVVIERSTAGEIAGAALRNGEPIPTIKDALKAVAGKTGLNLEIKSDGAGLLTAECLVSTDYRGYVLISSFKEDEVLAVRRLMPKLPASLIFDVFTVRDVQSYADKGYPVISLRKKTVTDRVVTACHERGIQVYVWTVDDEDEMRKFISLGVDGIYSNRPGALKELLRNVEFS